jgi:hypothetical protein
LSFSLPSNPIRQGQIQPRISESKDYETGQLEYRGELLGQIEFRILGLNTDTQFGKFRSGAGELRGRMISSLFDKRKDDTVLIRNSGDRISITLFGLMNDGVTATVLINPTRN